MSNFTLFPLGKIAKVIMGQSPPSSSYNTDGKGVPFFQGKMDFGETYPIVRSYCSEPTKLAMKNDLLVSVRAPIGALNIANTECCIGRGLAAIRANSDINYKYLFYGMKSVSSKLVSKGTGTTFKAIGKDTLSSIFIPIPTPEKQNKIAATLDAMSELIWLRKQQLADLEHLVKSRFIVMFGSVHESAMYSYKAIKEIAVVTSGGTPNRDNVDYWLNGRIPWIKTTELRNNVILSVEESITSKGLAESSAKVVPAGTILVAMYGQGKTRGMTAYLGIEASTNQACACILPSEKINQLYLWKYLIMSYDKLRGLAKGGNQPNLNGHIIKNFPVLMPPIEQQNQFAAFANHVDNLKMSIEQTLKEQENMVKSLMMQHYGDG